MGNENNRDIKKEQWTESGLGLTEIEESSMTPSFLTWATWCVVTISNGIGSKEGEAHLEERC